MALGEIENIQIFPKKSFITSTTGHTGQAWKIYFKADSH